MDAAIATEPAGALGALEGTDAGRRRMRRPATRASTRNLHRPALAALLAASFLIRIWGIKQGLPYSYNADEATHFVPRAIDFFSHDLNPHYFLNPPAYSYLLYIVLELWFGSADAVRTAFTNDPTAVYVVARLVAAVLGTVAVLLTYLAGVRLIGRSGGWLAAAMMGFGFLPVFYSHLALNDVPTLAPVALSLYGTAGVLRRGRKRDYAIAGVGIGLAGATKYTGLITAVCLLAAFTGDAAGDGLRRAGTRLLLGLGLAGLAFFVANPYAFLDTASFLDGVNAQASLAAGGGDPGKLGLHGGGTGYYLWTFTWGLGWVPTLAALAGAVLLVLRRRVALALLLLPAPIVFIVFMGNQQRFFGRWLLPIFPIVALLAAYGVVELVRWLAAFIDPRPERRAAVAAAAMAAATVLLLAQSVTADFHSDAVLSRSDTRNAARSWMVGHIPAGARVVIEPMVPDNWATDVGRSLPATQSGERWYRYPTWLSSLAENGNFLPAGQYRFVFVDEYERNLYPALLDNYVQGGYCWLVIGSLQAGRAFSQPGDVPAAIAYYGELAHRARLAYHVSPFDPGAHPVPFSFDWSIDYYPRQYRRPGPEISVYHLTGARCGR
jgi:4-amino-4-deoxy-L-arabinose transferase-like glycosyltransferase